MKAFNSKSITLSLFLCLFITGCMSVTMTKVTPANPNPEGLRVYYPAEFLVGRLNTNGLITYDVESLPDPNSEYAISSYGFLSKYTVSISRSPEMYLNELDLNQDSSTLASSTITGAGQVGAAYIQALQQKETEQQSKGTNSPTQTQTQTPQTQQTQTTPQTQTTSQSPQTQSTNPSPSNPNPTNNPASTPALGPIIVMYQILEDTNGVELNPVAFNINSFHWMTKKIDPASNLTRTHLLGVPPNAFDQ